MEYEGAIIHPHTQLFLHAVQEAYPEQRQNLSSNTTGIHRGVVKQSYFKHTNHALPSSVRQNFQLSNFFLQMSVFWGLLLPNRTYNHAGQNAVALLWAAQRALLVVWKKIGGVGGRTGEVQIKSSGAWTPSTVTLAWGHCHLDEKKVCFIFTFLYYVVMLARFVSICLHLQCFLLFFGCFCERIIIERKMRKYRILFWTQYSDQRKNMSEMI